jgi:hypothetical protein
MLYHAAKELTQDELKLAEFTLPQRAVRFLTAEIGCANDLPRLTAVISGIEYPLANRDLPSGTAAPARKRAARGVCGWLRARMCHLETPNPELDGGRSRRSSYRLWRQSK